MVVLFVSWVHTISTWAVSWVGGGQELTEQSQCYPQSYINVGISSLLPQSTLIREDCYKLAGGSEYI